MPIGGCSATHFPESSTTIYLSSSLLIISTLKLGYCRLLILYLKFIRGKEVCILESTVSFPVTGDIIGGIENYALLNMEEIWDLWQDTSHSPYLNMAIDEALMLTAAKRNRPVLRLYEWQDDAVSIGYTQKMSRVPQKKGAIVRRPTGGGIVFHKHHFTYTVVMPNSHWIVKGTKPVESYNWINQAVQSSLKLLEMESSLAIDEIPKTVDRAGMVCFVTPTKYDLLSGERKIAGSAQRRAREGMLHQGSIEMEGIDILSASTLRRVLPDGFREILKCEFKSFIPSEELLQMADKISREKYSGEEWNNKR